MELIFDEESVSRLTGEWQRTGDVETLNAILLGCRAYVDCLMHMHADDIGYNDRDDARQEANVKLIRALAAFKPGPGMFSYLSVALKHIFWKWIKHQRIVERAVPMEEKTLIWLVNDRFRVDPVPIAELGPFIRRAYNTRFHGATEREAQKWLIESLIETGDFPLLKHFKARFLSRGFAHRQLFVLYHYVLVQLRILSEREGITPSLSPLRANPLSPVFERARALLGAELFFRVCRVFGGFRIKFPSELESANGREASEPDF